MHPYNYAACFPIIHIGFYGEGRGLGRARLKIKVDRGRDGSKRFCRLRTPVYSILLFHWYDVLCFVYNDCKAYA